MAGISPLSRPTKQACQAANHTDVLARSGTASGRTACTKLSDGRRVRRDPRTGVLDDSRWVPPNLNGGLLYQNMHLWWLDRPETAELAGYS